MKKKLLIIAGVVIVLLAGLILAPNLIDWNKFKPEVSDSFRAATGHTIQIDGDLTFNLLPSPALTVSGVSLANVPGGQAVNFLELENLDLRLELWPLLNGDYKITSLVLEGGKIYLERDAEGVANWEVLFAGDAGDEKNEVAMKSFILRDTDVSYVDAGTGESKVIKDIDAEFILSSLTGPFEGKGEFRYQDTEVEFEFSTGELVAGENVPIRVSLIPAGDDPGLGFSGTYVEQGGVMAVSGTLEVGGDNAENLLGFLARAGGREPLPEGDWDNALEGQATLFAVLTGDKTEVTLEPLSLTFGESTLEGNITLVQTEVLNAAITLEIDSLDLDRWLAGESEAEGDFELPEGVTGSFTFEVGEVRYLGGEIDDVTLKANLAENRLTIEQFQAAIPGNTHVTLYGTLEAKGGRPVFAGNIDLESRNLKTLLDWLEVDYSDFPKNRLNRLAFKGKIRHAAPAFEIEQATATLDSTRFTGALTLNLDDMSRFTVTGTLNTLDLDSYFPALVEETETQNFADQAQSLQESLKGFAGYSGAINLAVDRLQIMAADVRGTELIANISPDTLVIKKLEVADFEGAAISFSGALNDISDAFGFDITIALSSDNLAPLMAWGGIESPFEERVVPSGNFQAGLKGDLSAATFEVTGLFSGVGFDIGGSAENLTGAAAYSTNLRLSHDNTVEFIRKFSPDYFPAKSALGAFSLNVRLTAGDDGTTLEGLVLGLGPVTVQGNLEFQERAGRPYISGNLSARQLTLDDFMAPSDAGLEAAVSEGGERWSTDRWNLDFLRENDFDVTLRADSLNFRTYRFLNPKVRLVNQGGLLRIENLTANLFEGAIAVDATLNVTSTPELDVTLDLNGVSTEAALKSSADITNLTGTMTFSGTFHGQGDSQKEIISSLSGNAKVSSEAGVIKGINMPRLSEQLGTLDNLTAFTRVIGAALEGGQTPYRYLRSEVAIRDGVVTFDKVDSDVDATEVGGRGRIDLPAWDMDITGAIRLKDQPDIPAIGVSMKGKVDNPDVKYDYIALTAFMTQKFTSNLFQQLLNIPAPEPEAVPGEAPVEGGETSVEEEAEPSPEEQIIRGLFDLFGGGDDEEETPPEEEEGGGGQ